MDIGTLRGLGTILVFIAFIAVVFWAFSSKRQQNFDEAANLPFADDEAHHKSHPQNNEQHPPPQ